MIASNDKKEIINLLIQTPLFNDYRGRRTIFTVAGLDFLASHFDLTGPTRIVASEVVDYLDNYGINPVTGIATLGELLNAIKDDTGLENQTKIDLLLNKNKLMVPIAKKIKDDGWANSYDSEKTLEAIIGENTLRPISFLEQGITKANCVSLIITKTHLGTGFLISDNLLITNYHVISENNLLNSTIFRFNYQTDSSGSITKFYDYTATGNGILFSNAQLDFSIIELKNTPGKKWGHLNISDDSINVGERVNIIQHPGGGPKQISLQNNFVQFVNSEVIQYVTSTLPGSSGSPVFNDNWNLVGLHHAGGMIQQPGSHSRFFRNEGINIAAIIKSLPNTIISILRA